MRPVWEIDGEDVENLQGDSTGFVRFLNALLGFHADAGRLPDSAVHLNQKDTEGDGGVDAVITLAISSGLDPTGRFGVPTCWQFEASPTENIKAKVAKGEEGGQQVALHQEINKPHSRRLVEQGYGYRFCIAADMPDQRKVQWEDWLSAAASEINPDAAPSSVLTASDLAVWANRFKPIVSEFFRPCLGPLRSLERWHREIAGLTPEFVAIGEWDAAVRAIREHVDFSRRVTTILTVQGEAGVGKTRCTCEALLERASHHALVLYTDDEKAAYEFAQVIARDDRLRAILVADECTLEFRDRLRQLLPGCADRLRVIAIDNSLQRAGGTGEVRLTHIDISEVEAILSRNFPDLPHDRRLSYARLAQGFVRLAVDLCENDSLVPPDGRVDSVFGFFHDYYLQRRLRPEELDAVLLISTTAPGRLPRRRGRAARQPVRTRQDRPAPVEHSGNCSEDPSVAGLSCRGRPIPLCHADANRPSRIPVGLGTMGRTRPRTVHGGVPARTDRPFRRAGAKFRHVGHAGVCDGFFLGWQTRLDGGRFPNICAYFRSQQVLKDGQIRKKLMYFRAFPGVSS